MGAKRQVDEAELTARKEALAERLLNGGLPYPEGLSQMRHSLGLSQEDFAEYLGMTQWRLSEIERGAANPRLETLRRIAQAFDLEIGFVRTDLEASKTRSNVAV